MLVGNLLTIIVSFSIGVVSLLVFLTERNIHGRFVNDVTRSFAFFWLLMGGAWHLTAFSNLFRYYGFMSDAIVMAYGSQIFIGASLIAAVYFANSAILRGWRRDWFVGAYAIFYAVFLFSLYYYGLHFPAEGFFANHIVSDEHTQAIFIIMFLPLWAFSVQLLFKTFQERDRVEKASYYFRIFASSSLIILGSAGFFDEVGSVTDWRVTALRLVMLVGAIFAYLAILVLQESDELTI